MPRESFLPIVLFLPIASMLLLGEQKPPNKETDAPAVAAARPIADALCGRHNRELHRAEALDGNDGKNVPEEWRKSTVSDVETWLRAPTCASPKPVEETLVGRRRRALEQIRARLAHVQILDEWEASMKPFPRWRPAGDAWPSNEECAGCAALRQSANVLEKIAAEWPKNTPRETAQIGELLDSVERRESMLHQLCAAAPAAGARMEIEKRFKYYAWTDNGAQLLRVATWFRRLSEGCTGQ